jgi:hypothetical protein
MSTAKSLTPKTIYVSAASVLLFLWLLTSSCGRTAQEGPLGEEAPSGSNQNDYQMDAGLKPSPTTSVGDQTSYQPFDLTNTTNPLTPFPPVIFPPDATTTMWLDASGYTDGSDGRPETCEVNSDCITSNKCEIPICTASGLCSYLPIEDGMPCYSPIGNQICLDGICRTSSCGDGYLDTESGEICDDGNTITTDDCVLCREATCGDGFLHNGEEECEPALSSYCNEDCTLGSCGDGIVTSPAENCEPSIDGSLCNDDCRISDSPEWQISIEPDDSEDPLGRMIAMLLLDSGNNPILIALDAYEDDSNIYRQIIHVTKYDPDGEEVWQWSSDEEETPFVPSMDSNSAVHAILPASAVMDNTDHIVIAGAIYTEDLAQRIQPWLMKLTPEGLLDWSTTIDEDEYSLNAVAVDDLGKIMTLMAYGTNIFGSSPWNMDDPSIELFSADGTYREGSSVSISGEFSIRGALSSGIVGGESRFLLTGARDNTNGQATLLFMLDSDAGTVWDSPINYGDTADSIGFVRALPTSEGDIVVVGKTGFEPFDFPYSYWFERYGPDKTARFEDKKEFRTHQSSSQFYITQFSALNMGFPPMAVDAADNVLFSYSLRENVDTGTYLIIDKYDSEGEPVWERPLRYDKGPDDHYAPNDLVVGSQGIIYVLTSIWTDDETTFALMRWRDPDYSE